MTKMRKKVLVLGGTGWLGHNVALDLEEHGYDVTVCTRGRKSLFSDRVAHLRAIVANKSDEAAMAEILAEPYDAIIDTVPSETSIGLVCKYAPKVGHYVHCSSTGGYAPLPFVPCDETAPFGGFDSTSGWYEKAVDDRKAMTAFVNEGFRCTVIRPCYITGPGMLPLDNLGGRRLDFIADILAGKTLDLPNDGQALLQPIHVHDLAVSFRLAIETERSIGQIYNICLAHAIPLWRYLELNGEALGRKVSINCMPVDDMLRKYGDSVNDIWLRFLATHMCFTIDKARRDLGYCPHCTPEEAVRETAAWAATLSADELPQYGG